MNIVVALDLSESSETVVHKTAELAMSLAASVWILHVAEPDPDFVGYEAGPQVRRDAVSRHFHEEHQKLQAYSERCRNAGLEATALLVQGPTVDTILKEARKLEADLVVVGSHGKSALQQLLVGSVSEGILHKSPTPVLVIPTHKR